VRLAREKELRDPDDVFYPCRGTAQRTSQEAQEALPFTANLNASIAHFLANRER
jgi:hypothetical protein